MTFEGTVVATAPVPGTYLEKVIVNDQTVTVSWQAKTNGTYQLESSTDLVHWSVVKAGLTFTSASGAFTAPAPDPAAFFRLQYAPLLP